MLSLTMRKTSNLLKVLSSFATGLDLDIEPIHIDLEPTSRCNLKCSMCPHDTLSRAKGDMDLALFRNIVDQTVHTAIEYHMGIFGEPLLHPDIENMVTYAVDRGAKVVIFTNLAHKDDDRIRFLARNGVDRLRVNVCAADAKTYREIHGRDRLETVLHNLSLLRSTRDAAGARRPRVFISYLVMKKNGRVADSEVEWLSKYCDDIEVKTIHDWLGVPEINSQILEDPQPAFHQMRCSRLWASAAIQQDGRVAMCCYDFDAKHTFGDLRSMTIKEIWNSPKIRAFRKNYRGSNPCRTCRDPHHQLAPINLLFMARNWLTD